MAAVLSPTDDRIFKAMLIHPDAEPALMDLISASIWRTVTSVNIRKTELPIMDTEEKNERLDVNCVVDGGDQANVEIQGSRIEEVANDHENFINKTIYYLTDLHSSQKSKGLKYNELVRTYQITFSAYTVFPEYPDYVSLVNMRRANGDLITDQINALIVELSKLGGVLKKPVEEMTPLEMWSAFLRYAADPGQRELINEILKRREAMAMAGTVLRTISKDEHERARYMARRKYETDMTSNILTAEARGEIRERQKWQTVLADKDAALADKDALIAELRARLGEGS